MDQRSGTTATSPHFRTVQQDQRALHEARKRLVRVAATETVKLCGECLGVSRVPFSSRVCPICKGTGLATTGGDA
jgi:hypothetical protein